VRRWIQRYLNFGMLLFSTATHFDYFVLRPLESYDNFYVTLHSIDP